MKISQLNYLNNYINFKGQNDVQASCSSDVQAQPKYDNVTSMPANFMNPKVPVSYSKINEFTIPQTDTKVQMYKLSNGQTVVLAPKKGKTQISTYVKCGSMNEKDNIRGISHYIEHNLFNGSKKIQPKELFETINKMGAYANAWTSEETTSYLIQSHLFDSEDLSKIIELHSDMIQYPKFEQSQLDKEKGVVNSEITMYDDDNLRILLGKSMKQLFQIKSESNDLVGGTVKNINNLTRDDVINYYNENYTPDKMVTVLTGEFDPDKAIEFISKNFTKKAVSSQKPEYHEKFNPIEKTVRTDITSPLITNDEFIMSFRGPDNSNLKDTFCVRLIMNMLSGAKHTKLEKNLKGFNVSPELMMDKAGNGKNDPKIINLLASSSPKDTQNVLNTIYSTIHNMKSENLNEDLATSKKSLIKAYNMVLETSAGTNDFLGKCLREFSPDEITKIPEIINSIDENDIKTALNKYFDLNKVSIVVSHPQKSVDNKVSFKGKLKKSGLNLNEFKYAKLQNNAEVYLKNDANNLKQFSLSINSEIPANVNPLVPQLLEEILSKGSVFNTEEGFSSDLAKRSTNLAVMASANGIKITSNALNEDIDYALLKAVELIKNPKLTQTSLDEAKKRIEKSINEEVPSPMSCFDSIMFPQMNSNPTKEDKLKALKNISLGDILGFCEYLKQNSNLYFAWNKSDVPYILTELGQFKPAQKTDFKTYTPLTKDILKTESYNAGQAKIIKAYKFKSDNSPMESAKIAVMNQIFGGGQASRLFTDLRENQKLAYSTGSYTDTYGDTGLLVMRIGTTTDNAQDISATSSNITKSLDGFNRNIERMKNELVSETELESAKLSVKSQILSAIERNSDKIISLSRSVINHKNPNYINELLSKIDEVTALDVQKTANKVFEGHSLTSIVASEKTLKELNLQ